MLRSGGFEVETGELEGECLWLKATMPGPTQASLPHDLDGAEADGATCVEFRLTVDGKSITAVTLTQDVWERTDQRTLARLETKG
jgi:hypothetical protein